MLRRIRRDPPVSKLRKTDPARLPFLAFSKDSKPEQEVIMFVLTKAVQIEGLDFTNPPQALRRCRYCGVAGVMLCKLTDLRQQRYQGQVQLMS